MVKQCAGCATVFEDGNEPLGETSPRPYGCCPDCNSTSFRTHEQNEVKTPANVITIDHKDGVGTVTSVQSAAEPSQPPKDALDSVSELH